jgi:PKD domain
MQHCRGLALLAAPVMAAGLAFTPAATGLVRPQTAASGPASGNTRYAQVVPLCPPAKPGHVTCFAMRLVRASRGTPGARAYRLAAGAATIGPAGGLTPGDLATAYGFTPTAAARGQKVAIIDWGDDPTIASDLNTFDTHYHLPACTTANGCFRKLNQSGKTSPLPTDQRTAFEIALDVETVHAVCQKCKIDLFEAYTSTFRNVEAAVNEAVKLGATEISNSYGGADKRGPSTADKAAYNHPGVVITVSSGDDGYYGFDQWPNTPPGGPAANPSAPDFPAEAATVVSVGGTSLYLNTNGTRRLETVWNENGPQDAIELAAGFPIGATGGGCSLFISAPRWQRKLTAWPRTVCGTKRLTADVSAVADPFTGFDIYNTSDLGTGWVTIGGTSLTSPLIAAMYALAGGSHGIAYPALTVYGHLGTRSLHDVVAGGNGFCGGEGAAQCGNWNHQTFNGTRLGVLDCDYPATGSTPSAGDLACDASAGYDGPTGAGTPNGLGAFAKTGPAAMISGPQSIKHGTAHSWTVSSRDPFPGGTVTSYTWSWGDGTARAVTATARASHTYAAPGSYTITLKVKDNYGATGTATYKLIAS